MAEILDGKLVAKALDETCAARVAALRAQGIFPKLAILRMGERPDDLSYERGALKRCEKVGIETERFLLPADAPQEALLEAIGQINGDGKIHGCLMFRPLPKHIDDAAARAALSPAKDVDGITEGSLAGVFTGSGAGFAPCTAEACMKILEYYHMDPAGKNAVVVGRSLVIGRPVAMLLMHKNATVTICHTKTRELAAQCRQGEILVAAAGKLGAVGAESFAPGQIVLDVGIHVREDGSLAGDADFGAAQGVVQAITPVPGGVGSVTTSVLALHVTEAAEKLSGR